METFLQNYLDKCDDYSVKPKNRLVKELEQAIAKRKLFPHLILNGNCVSMFEDRITDIEVFPLCELLEKDVQCLSLELSYNHIGDYGASSIARMIATNNNLKHISLKGNSITSKGCFEIAEALAKNESLISFDISENDIDDEGGMSIFKKLQMNRTVEILNLNNTGLRTSSIILLAIVMRNHPSITTLKIAKPILHSVEEETCLHLAEMFKLNNTLTSIDLSHHGIRTEGMEALVRGLMFNTRITDLKLSGNEIGIDGAKALARYMSKENCSLKHLDLSYNNIRDAGCLEISKALNQNAQIVSLDIRSNSIQNEGLVAIGQVVLNKIKTDTVPVLRKLTVLNNAFDQESMILFDGIQKKNEEYVQSKMRKKKLRNSLEDLVELDIVIYQTDDIFFIAEKRDCVKPTPTIDTRPEQIAEIEQLLGLDKILM